MPFSSVLTTFSAMGDYLRVTQLLLGEAGKYLALLVLVVLSVRLWRRWRAGAVGGNRNNLLAACAASALAVGAGYFSICHSLGRLYSYYGTEAMGAGHLESGVLLLDQSARYWRSADAVGGRGVCLLLLGQTNEGMQGLEEAKAMRHGHNSPLEQFYQGLHYFFQNQPDKAAPLLAAASGETKYGWQAAKLTAVMALEANRPAEAEQLMSPFQHLEVPETDPDQGYVMASLLLFQGRTNESKKLLDRFPDEKLSAFWKAKFGKLRARTQP